jgi:Tol biopolymer transport system component
MPTFSPDGKRIAFSWSGQGVGVMNSDGTDRQILDPRGWGAQWSPDGKSIAFGVGRNIAVLNVKANEKRMILEDDQAMRYSYISWNMGWSRDSKRICFKARNRTNQNYEIAVTKVTGSSSGFDVLYESKGPTYSNMSWHPDGKRIMFAMNDPARFFTLDREKPGPPLLLPGQPEEYKNMDGDWSRDGKQIVFAGQRLPTWEVWSGKTESNAGVINTEQR